MAGTSWPSKHKERFPEKLPYDPLLLKIYPFSSKHGSVHQEKRFQFSQSEAKMHVSKEVSVDMGGTQLVSMKELKKQEEYEGMINFTSIGPLFKKKQARISGNKGSARPYTSQTQLNFGAQFHQ
mmetsp:Transcript_42538/g.31150  ORF Transcript_42538/g.31150 Transcript_42538/m.31150 type:complete len:124 (-) Transcript_42538:1901-2272(-)